MKAIPLIFLLFLAGLAGNCQKKKNLVFSVKLDTNCISKMTDLDIQLIFKNTGNINILVTRLFDYSYKKGPVPRAKGDLIWEAEKLMKNKFIEQPATRETSGIPFYVPKEEQFDTLRPQKSIVKKFSLYDFYELNVGTYRIRAKYIIPKIVGLPVKFLYSNWYKFYIKKPIRYSLD